LRATGLLYPAISHKLGQRRQGIKDYILNIIVDGPMILRYFNKIREMSNDFCPFRAAFP